MQYHGIYIFLITSKPVRLTENVEREMRVLLFSRRYFAPIDI